MVVIAIRVYTYRTINNYVFKGKLPKPTFKNKFKLLDKYYRDVIEAIRNNVCPYCGRKFTRTGLRTHLLKPAKRNPCYLQHQLTLKSMQLLLIRGVSKWLRNTE